MDESTEEPVVMTKIALLIMLVTGIILPIVNIYTDVGFSWTLFKKDHIVFAVLLLIPIVIFNLVILRWWWTWENKIWKRVLTFPIVMLTLWPQYRTLKLMYKGWCKKDPEWKEEEKKLQRDIGSLGKMLNTVDA